MWSMPIPKLNKRQWRNDGCGRNGESRSVCGGRLKMRILEVDGWGVVGKLPETTTEDEHACQDEDETIQDRDGAGVTIKMMYDWAGTVDGKPTRSGGAYPHPR